MLRQITKICSVVCILLSCGLAYSAAQDSNSPKNTVTVDVVTISIDKQFDAVRPGAKSALAVHFKLEKDWHFYASAKTAFSKAFHELIDQIRW